MSYPTPEATPPDSVEGRRQRRRAAGRSGGEFELIRQGDVFTFRYASPDPRRHEASGQYSWERTPSTDVFGDFDASSTHSQAHSQSQTESTSAISPINQAQENKSRSSSETRNAVVVDDSELTPLLGTLPRRTSPESMYSRDSNGEEIQGVFSLHAVSHAPFDDISNKPTQSTSQADRRNSVGTSKSMIEDGSHVKSMLSSIESRSAATKKGFVKMKSMRSFAKKVMQKEKGIEVVRKVFRLLKPSTHHVGLVVRKDNDDGVRASNELRSGRQGVAHDPSTPKAQIIGQKPDSPVKEQVLRENDHDLPQPTLDKDFFTPPGYRKKSNKEPKRSPDADVFD